MTSELAQPGLGLKASGAYCTSIPVIEEELRPCIPVREGLSSLSLSQIHVSLKIT